MGYTLMNDEIVFSEEEISAPDAVVYYDKGKSKGRRKDKARFLIYFTETGSVEVVKRNNPNLYKNKKYLCDVIGELIPEAFAAEDFVILLTNAARNAISLICDGNRNLN